MGGAEEVRGAVRDPMTRIEIRAAAIRTALEQSNGFVQRAARRLGVGRNTLIRRMSEIALHEEAQRLRTATGWTVGRPQ